MIAVAEHHCRCSRRVSLLHPQTQGLGRRHLTEVGMAVHRQKCRSFPDDLESRAGFNVAIVDVFDVLPQTHDAMAVMPDQISIPQVPGHDLSFLGAGPSASEDPFGNLKQLIGIERRHCVS